MIASSDVLALYRELAVPDADDGDSLTLSAVRVEGLESLRIAKDGRGSPAVLVTQTDSGPSRPPLALRHLNVIFDVPCRIVSSDGEDSGIFIVLRCINATRELEEYFLVVTVAALQSREPELSSSAINEVIAHLTELFRSLSKRSPLSIRGLWGELLVIASSTDPQRLISAWHTKPNDLHDFNDGLTRIEVKTAARERKHRFSAEQLAEPPTKLYVLSLIVEESPQGLRIPSLRDLICERVSWDAELVQKLDLMIAESVGDRISSVRDHSFDEARALESIRFYDSDDLPKLTPPFPDGISRVEFDVDLSHIQSLTVDELRRVTLPAAALPTGHPFLSKASAAKLAPKGVGSPRSRVSAAAQASGPQTPPDTGEI